MQYNLALKMDGIVCIYVQVHGNFFFILYFVESIEISFEKNI